LIQTKDPFDISDKKQEELTKMRKALKKRKTKVTFGDVKEQAELLRQFFINKYSKGRSLARFRANKMSYREKRSIVNWLFSGKNDTGKHY